MILFLFLKEMVNSIKFIIERLKIVPEPAAAACLVPILNNKISLNQNQSVL